MPCVGCSVCGNSFESKSNKKHNRVCSVKCKNMKYTKPTTRAAAPAASSSSSSVVEVSDTKSTSSTKKRTREMTNTVETKKVDVAVDGTITTVTNTVSDKDTLQVRQMVTRHVLQRKRDEERLQRLTDHSVKDWYLMTLITLASVLITLIIINCQVRRLPISEFSTQELPINDRQD